MNMQRNDRSGSKTPFLVGIGIGSLTPSRDLAPVSPQSALFCLGQCSFLMQRDAGRRKTVKRFPGSGQNTPITHPKKMFHNEVPRSYALEAKKAEQRTNFNLIHGKVSTIQAAVLVCWWRRPMKKTFQSLNFSMSCLYDACRLKTCCHILYHERQR